MQLGSTVSLDEMRARFNGRVITPEDSEYEAACTVFYGGSDRRPAGILRPQDADEVARAVLFARESGLELAVRSGGHSLAGHSLSDGGLVLDLAGMRGMDVDVERRTAWAGSGLTAGEYTAAAGTHGLATGFGDAATVGIGGITLGGGVGFLVRKHGLTIDALLAADMVTADGELRRVDAASHPDLFWAIRGGGGNFGVVTRFQFRLHDVDVILGGMLLLPATPETISGFVAHAEAAPDELSTIVNVMVAPPMPFVPAEHHGKLLIMALLAYAGPVEAGERVIAPFRALAAPIADMVRPVPYPEMFPPEQPGYHPVVAVRTLFLDAFDRVAAQAIIERLQTSTAPMRVAQLRVLGGAMGRVAADATAFAHRERRIMATVVAMYEAREQADEHEAWVERFAAVLGNGAVGAYVNFLGDEGEARVREAYPASTWQRLAEVKRRYDPSNLFRLNHNIPPSTETAHQG